MLIVYSLQMWPILIPCVCVFFFIVATSQIQYLKSIFVELEQFPGTNDGGSDMSMRSFGEIGSDPMIGFWGLRLMVQPRLFYVCYWI